MNEPTEADVDKAFADGWNTEKLGDNPYPEQSTLGRFFVDGWVTRIRVKRLGLIP